MKLPSVKFPQVRRGRAEEQPGIVGVARVDRRTKALVKRLVPGDIAVIDHADLDRVSADELIACRVAAVVNAAKSITGRYPNLGPRLLIDAGIPLVDDVGREILTRIQEGALVRLDGNSLYAAEARPSSPGGATARTPRGLPDNPAFPGDAPGPEASAPDRPAGQRAGTTGADASRGAGADRGGADRGGADRGGADRGGADRSGAVIAGGQVIAKGVLQTAETVRAAVEEAKAGVATQIDSFAANTLEFLRRERDMLTNGITVPDLHTRMQDRHVLVVVRGYRYREDLRALRPYIREYKPVMLAVDGGADALLEAGYRPHVIIGDMDSITDDALGCGAELVVHAYPDGRAPGLARIFELGLDAAPLPAAGTSEDVALLLADAMGASLIAVVGTHWTLEEFLDKGRPGMSSTFLTHLRVGGKLVNAHGVHQLYQSRISGRALLALVLAAAVTVIVAVSVSPVGPILGNYFSATWHTFAYWLTGLFT